MTGPKPNERRRSHQAAISRVSAWSLDSSLSASSGMHSKHSTRSPYSSVAYSRDGDALRIAFTMYSRLGAPVPTESSPRSRSYTTTGVSSSA
jgi:hypothetical protein